MNGPPMAKKSSVEHVQQTYWQFDDSIGAAVFGATRGVPIQVAPNPQFHFEKESAVSPMSPSGPSTSPTAGAAGLSPRDLGRGNGGAGAGAGAGAGGHGAGSGSCGSISSAFRTPRHDLAALEASTPGPLYPYYRQNSPRIPPPAASGAWAVRGGSGPMPPSSPATHLVGDIMDTPPQLSPLSRPAGGKASVSECADTNYFEDGRRPSVASVATASSQGSQSSTSRGLHRKLHNFFGEDYREHVAPHYSETNPPVAANGSGPLPPPSHHRRNNSVATTSTGDGRTTSPNSRPHTPMPSSEVTPWVFQDSEDIPLYGNPPVRQAPAGPDKQRYVPEHSHTTPLLPTVAAFSHHHSPHHSHHSHRLHLPGHKHNKSREDPPKSPHNFSREPGARPAVFREDYLGHGKRLPSLPPSAMSPSSSFTGRPLSPPPPPPPPPPPLNLSQATPLEGIATAQRPPATAPKRSFLSKWKFSKGHREDHEGLLKNLNGSTKSLLDPHPKSGSKPIKIESASSKYSRKRDGSASSFDASYPGRALDYVTLEVHEPRKTSTGKAHSGHGKQRLLKRNETSGSKDLGITLNETDAESTLLYLDTDLTDMEGIVSKRPPITPPDGGIFTGLLPGDDGKTSLDEAARGPANGAEWNAPDSWAVKKPGDENILRLREIDPTGVPPQDADGGIPYCVRVFRIDGTFATLSAHLNSTVDELLRQLGKKSFLQDDLENYQIIMRKQDLQRVLEPGERPIAIQKRLLEQAGYTEADRLDEIGREDNSYLGRFTFVPTRLSGYYSLERDPGFAKMQKFSHVDLSGRNLITIPITLHQKATEIISLNLSRNLSLDVPKDFVQSCINLREIKYTGNEAWKLPPSLSLASRLTYLDVSNNRLEQLEHAELDKIQGLLSIKAANNIISSIPLYFQKFRTLRILNISSNCLSQFPEYCCNMTSLVDLDISFNSISSLPDRIGQLENLERLLVTNNRLVGSLPKNFSKLKNLREIDIRFNAISSVEVFSQLPRLEQFLAGHNSIAIFEGSFPRIRTLQLNHNPVNRFSLAQTVPSLTTLNLSDAKLPQLPDDGFEKMPNLEKLILDKNLFTTLTKFIGKLFRLEHLSLAKNALSSLPPEIGCLQNLRYLDVRENNLKRLPPEIWYAVRLDTLNVSSNVLEAFPKPGTAPQMSLGELLESPMSLAGHNASNLSTSPSLEDVRRLESVAARRPSQGGLLCVGSSPAQRDGSIVSVYGPGGRKASVISRTMSEGTLPPGPRKDSGFSSRLASTFAGSLRHLYLAFNNLNDEVFDEITLLPELRILNLSYNDLYDVPTHSLTRWPHLTELYLSGNELSSLPSDDFHRQSLLKVLHINGNKFQVLPADLGKIDKLTVLDCGSNALKYNVSNVPYDWNWNYNRNLKYLNLSGNKRLEIKPSQTSVHNREGRDLTDFTSLLNLRVLGLMDVTLMAPSVPDQTEDRRIRTSGSYAGSMPYGMADTLGKHEHLSTIDMVVPKFGSHEAETLLGMFDGQALSSGGSKVAKFLHENFNYYFGDEMSRLAKGTETPVDALRRTFLGLNKELATAALQSLEGTPHHIAHRGSVSSVALTQEDAHSGGVATVMFLQGNELYVANVGDAQALLIQSEGGHKIVTRKHHPVEPSERQRIREAGGYVSRNGKLNDVLDVSRAFGYIQFMPAVMAAPHIAQISLKEQDEMVLIASRELWDYLTPDVVVDVARSERGDLMRAAQKLRDLAIAFGATGKIMVMILGVSDLKLRERQRFRAQSLSMGPSGLLDEQFFLSKRPKRNKGGPDDSVLRRLDQEVEAPTGDVSMVFTDIKNSTHLWETYPMSMRSAIKQHNALMRRQLRIIGGYEVKTEGDAFMVSFPTATSALLWCFTVQSQLLEIEWPAEVLNSVHGQEVLDAEGNVIFRGLSVRMGIHWGAPVCEPDPVTRRMDYFGPMVNRASRISSVADGGQITVSSDFIGEIQRVLELYQETEGDGLSASDDAPAEDLTTQAIRRELRSLSLQGFEVKDLGERRLKGLENPEYVYLVYPHSLAGRVAAQQPRTEAESAQLAQAPTTLSNEGQLLFDTDIVWQLWNVTLRLEMLCSALEDVGSKTVKSPETMLLEKMKNQGGEVTDRFLMNFVEHQVSRVETCSTALYLRHLQRPFNAASSNLASLARPMDEVLSDTEAKLAIAAEVEAKEARLRAIAARLGVNFDDM